MDNKIEVLDDILEVLECLKSDIEKQRKIVLQLEAEPDNEELIKKYKLSMTSLVLGYIALDGMQRKQLEDCVEITGLDLELKEKEE